MMRPAPAPPTALLLLLGAAALLAPAAESHSRLLFRGKAAAEDVPPQLDPTNPQMVQTFQKSLLGMQEYLVGSAIRLQKRDEPFYVEYKERVESIYESLGKCEGPDVFVAPVRKLKNLLRTSAEHMSDISLVTEDSWERMQKKLRNLQSEGQADLESPTLRAVDLKAVRTEYIGAMRRSFQKVGSLLMRANATCHHEAGQLEELFSGHAPELLQHRGRLRYASCRKVFNVMNEDSQEVVALLRGKCNCDSEALMDFSARLEYISSLTYSSEGLPADPSSRLNAFLDLFPEAASELHNRGHSCKGAYQDRVTAFLEDPEKMVTDVRADDIIKGEKYEDADGDGSEAGVDQEEED